MTSPHRSRSPVLIDEVLPSWAVLLITTALALAVTAILLLPSTGLG